MIGSVLYLEDGSCFEGESHSIHERAGEVVFNTSHSGYEEIATDPSYFSQIVVMTAPMQGNYGTDKSVWESKRYFLEGFISLELQSSLRDSEWLKNLNEQGKSILSGVDTRRLVLHLRKHGTVWGAIVKKTGDWRERALELIREKQKTPTDWCYLTSRTEIEQKDGNLKSGPITGILDFGCKENIIRLAQQRSSKVLVFPSRTPASVIQASGVDCLILSNGPGDPASVEVAPDTIRTLKGKIPMFGICMGHQVLGRALGGETFKLRFGHRGSNHPVKDLRTGQVYVTSQNHGYALNADTLPSTIQVTHINLNDSTVAGLMDERNACFSVQFHPESCPGPHEAQTLFDDFYKLI